MSRYRVYTFESNKYEYIHAENPKDAAMELASIKYNVTKRFLHIKEVETPIQAVPKNSETLGIIVVGNNGELYFYSAKLKSVGLGVTEPKNNKLAFVINSRSVNDFISLYINTLDSPSNRIWGIVEQLINNNATSDNWVKVASNHFKCSDRSIEGDTKIEIIIDDIKNTMIIIADNPCNKRYKRTTTANDMNSLLKGLIVARMV